MSSVKISGNASGTGILTIAAPNTNTDRTLTLPDVSGTVALTGGSVDETLNNLTLNGGLYLGGTGAANYLDDYETGTWTPANNSNITINSIQNADYIKVGNVVIVNAWIKVNITSASFILQGLPFSISGRTCGSLNNVTQTEVIMNQALGSQIYGYGATTVGTNDDLFISLSYYTV